MQATYDPLLIALSYAVAAFAAYVSIGLMPRIREAQGRERLLWLGTGASAMGCGIWSMHFIGMLAFKMDMPVAYDVPLTLLSLLIAIVTSGAALNLAARSSFAVLDYLTAGIILGLSIASMHYIGMEAMIMPMIMHYDPVIVAASLAIAIGASIAAIWLLAHEAQSKISIRIGSALVIGFAVAGMHYTGMAAVSYEHLPPSMEQQEIVSGLDSNLMAVSIAFAMAFLLAITLLSNDRSRSRDIGRRQIGLLIVIMSAIALGATGIAINLLYHTALKQRETQITTLVKSQAALLDAVARFDLEHSSGAHPQGSRGATLSQFQEAQNQLSGQKNGPRLFLAEIGDERIALMYQVDAPPIYMTRDASDALPILKAAAGHSGVMRTLDSISGNEKLTAYAPVSNMGLVMLVDLPLSAIQRPFIHAGMVTTSLSLVLIALGSGLFLGITRPILTRLKDEISNRAASEAALQAAHDQLEERVKERTADLQREVDERERVAAMLHRSSQFHEKIMENSTNAIFVLGPDLRFTLFNPMVTRITGHGSDTLLTATLVELFADSKKPELQSGIDNAFANGSALRGYEATLIRADGVDRDVVISLAPIFEGDKVTALVGAMEDVTDIRHAHAELVKAKEKAEESSRTKSEFLANMSHEIRTPMNGVLGMLNLLRDTRLDASQRDYSDTAYHSAETLLALLNDILDLSKIEAGRMEIERSEFDLYALVEETGSLFAARAHEKGLELAVDIASDVPPRAIGDSTRIRQIISNLAGNAIKFTQRGEVLIRASCSHTENDKLYLRFEVRDTGIGIPKEAQAKVFESFTQADSSTTRRFGGTGLGLTISRQLITLMGGEIGLESEPGKGSTFWFTVPLGHVTVSAGGGSDESIDVQGLKVLIVDDNDTNRAILERQLDNWGMHHGSTDGATAALAEMRRAKQSGARYQVALLDMMMPGMDGMQLAELIQHDPDLSSTRLIMLTSATQNHSEDELKSHGISVCLSKPARQSMLYDAIVTVTHKQAPAKPVEVVEAAAPTATQTSERSERILVAEDNSVNQKVIRGMLRRLGFNATMVENGAEAVEEVSSGNYDLVLMDCQMPKMDGYEASRRIRQLDSDVSQIPIVALTANAMRGDEEKCLAAGMSGYLSKPIKPEALAGAIEQWLASTGTNIAKENNA